MTVAPEGEWTVEAHLRGKTYGTEAQARATGERWGQLMSIGAQRDVELVEVVVRDPSGRRTDECPAHVRHGPGHQSKTRCRRHGAHELHTAYLEVAGETVYWRGRLGTTGAFDESPLDPDDPYTHVEHRGYWVLCCKDCDSGEPLPHPFKTVGARDEWRTAHAEGTEHTNFYTVDPPETADLHLEVGPNGGVRLEDGTPLPAEPTS